MKIGELFPSRYIKATDLDGDQVFTIEAVKREELNGEARAVVDFKESETGLVLNRTNANTIASLYGQDTEDWLGQRITLFATEVDFRGQQTLATRVRMRQPEEQEPEVTKDTSF